MSDFTRYQCWQRERVGEVINKEAIAIDIADFMATHAPLGQIRDVRAGGGHEPSEADLWASSYAEPRATDTPSR